MCESTFLRFYFYNWPCSIVRRSNKRIELFFFIHNIYLIQFQVRFITNCLLYLMDIRTVQSIDCYIKTLAICGTDVKLRTADGRVSPVKPVLVNRYEQIFQIKNQSWSGLIIFVYLFKKDVWLNKNLIHVPFYNAYLVPWSFLDHKIATLNIVNFY